MSDSSLLTTLRASFNAGVTPVLFKPLPTDVTIDEQLDILDQVLADFEATQVQEVSAPVSAMAAAMPQFALQATDTLNPSHQVSTTTIKEGASKSALEMVSAEAGIGLQAVEEEIVPEISPEVESFLERVEDHQEQVPQEIVIADGATQLPTTTHHPSQPVIVLSITPSVEKEGERKSPKFSVRWLVEWSHKIIKMFTGRVIYREA